MRIGLIAGSGQFPLLFTNAAKRKGFSVFTVAYLHEADPDLENHVDAIEWIHLGQVNKLIRFFRLNDINEAVMVGGVKKTKIFSDVKPDMKAISLFVGLKHTHDDEILRAFANMLEKEGIKIRSSTFLIPELLAPEGCWTKRKPSRSEKADIDLGWNLAKEIGRLDVGQCVLIGGGSVLAIEAIDGTDATIKRGGKLGSGKAVVIKVCKPNQDFRFDIPAVGTRTIETIAESGATALAIEAGKTVVFDRLEMIAKADRSDITIIARK